MEKQTQESFTVSRLLQPNARVSDSSAIIVSTSEAVRDGIELVVDGIRTANFEKNPVVLWSHDHNAVPVAKATRIYKEGDSLRADFEWNTEDAFAQKIEKAWRNGFLNATSVTFSIDEWTVNEETDSLRAIESELFEFSIVTVPADPDALATTRRQINERILSMGETEQKIKDEEERSKNETVEKDSADEMRAQIKALTERVEKAETQAKADKAEAERAARDSRIRTNYVPDNFDVKGKSSREILEAYNGLSDASRNDNFLEGYAEHIRKTKSSSSSGDTVTVSNESSVQAKRISASEIKRRRKA